MISSHCFTAIETRSIFLNFFTIYFVWLAMFLSHIFWEVRELNFLLRNLVKSYIIHFRYSLCIMRIFIICVIGYLSKELLKCERESSIKVLKKLLLSLSLLIINYFNYFLSKVCISYKCIVSITRINALLKILIKNCRCKKYSSSH